MKSKTLERLENLVEIILENNSEDTALIYDDLLSQQRFSYKTLCRSLERTSLELLTHCCEGMYVGINASTTPDTIFVLLSLLKIKAIACPLSFDKDIGNASHVCDKMGIKFIIIERHFVDDTKGFNELGNLNKMLFHPLASVKSMVLIELEYQKCRSTNNSHGIDFVVASSGSTGPPKVIQVPGKCIIPNIFSLCDMFHIKDKDVVFLSSPLTFDASIVQIFLSLVAKATLLIVPDQLKKQPSNLSKVLFTRNKTSILQATPLLVFHLGESLCEDQLTFADTLLRVLCLGAEPFLRKSVIKKMIGSSPNIEVYNIYGISEVSSWASIEKVPLSLLCETENDGVPALLGNLDEGSYSLADESINAIRVEKLVARSVPIGSPLSGTKIELRYDGEEIDAGIGEIWIGGKDRVCLLNDETDLVPYQMRPSGDIGLRRNGKLFYVGRKDHRVKIWGQFVDLELIENAVQELQSVKSSVCVCKKTNAGNNGSLVLFLSIFAEYSKFDVESAVFEILSVKFPANSCLCDIVFVSTIPLNLHGKKDRVALKKAANDVTSQWNSNSPMENVLLNFFEEAISRGRRDGALYDREKNFVENGGDSFSAVFLESRIENYLQALSPCNIEIYALYDKVLSHNFEEFCGFIRREIADKSKQRQCTLIESEVKDIECEIEEFDKGKGHKAIDNELTNTDLIVSNDLEKARKRQGKYETVNFHVSKSISKPFNEHCAVSRVSGNHLKRRKVTMNLENSEFIGKCEEAGDGMSKGQTLRCYCSASRGGRFRICDYCKRLGNSTPCSSIINELDGNALVKSWSFDTAKCIDASPLIVCCGDHSSNIAYIGSHSHYLYAVDTSHGGMIWKTELGDRIESSAVVSKNGAEIIVGCYDHCLYVISRIDGSISWTFPTDESIKCSPVVNPTNGHVYFGSHDHHCYALDIEKRVLVWRVYCGGGSLFSSPSISEDSSTLFVGTLGGNFLAIKANSGDIFWQISVKKPIFSSPICCDDYVCFGSVNGKLYFLQQDGKIVWSYETQGPIFSSPCILSHSIANVDRRILVGSHDRYLYCLSTKGHLIWKNELDSSIFSTPTLAFSSTSDSVLTKAKGTGREAYALVCSTKGNLYILNILDGSIINSHTFPKETFSSPVVTRNTIIVGCRDDNLYCLQLTK